MIAAALAITLAALIDARRMERERDTLRAQNKKLRALLIEGVEMSDVLADTVARLCFELERKERDPLGLGFHETLMGER